MILFAALLPIMTGFLTANALTHKTPLTHRTFFCLFIAGPLGLSIHSLIVFWSYVVGNSAGKNLTLLFNILFCLLLFVYSIKSHRLSPLTTVKKRSIGIFRSLFDRLTPSKNSRSQYLLNIVTLIGLLFFLFFLIHYTSYFIGKISWNIYGGWDGKYFWNLKAKFFFRTPGEWKGMFSPILDWAHPDYPLMLPGAVAWGWISTGKELLIWPPIVDYTFFTALCLLIVWYLGSYVSWWNAFLAGCYVVTIHMFYFWSTTQYADIPLTFFFTSATLLLILAMRLKEKRLVLLSGLLAGMSAWTKNEGLFFIFWIGLTLVILLWRDTTLTNRSKKSFLIFFLIGLIIPCSAVFFAKAFLGLKGGEYLGSGRTFSQYMASLFGSGFKTRFIALCFLVFKLNFKEWLGLWILFAGVLLFCGKKGFRNYRWVFVFTIFLVEFGYFLVIHVSPSDVAFQVKTALLRLMLHSAALALIFSFEATGPLSFDAKNQTRQS